VRTSSEKTRQRPIERNAPREIALPPDIFTPRSIAIFGASGEPGRLAHRPLDYLHRLGYPGRVYPINPNRNRILGWDCYPSFDTVPEPVDAALISLAAPLVPDALRACAARGVRLAVVLTSGLDPAERWPDDLLVMGPNCMGFLNAHGQVAAAWSSSLDQAAVRTGRVGLIAQSGGLGGSVLNRLQDRGVGVSYTFWSGNEQRVDACHLLELLLDDAETRVIALLVEGFRRPRRFLELAELALERGKPLIVLKLARAPMASAMAEAHTGILAGSARTYRAAFRQRGVIEVGGLDELVETTALFARTPLPAGDGLGVISSSGGATVMVTDLCHELGLRLPPLSPDTTADIAAMLPPYAAEPTNPLDITAGLSEQALFEPLERLAADPVIDLVLNVVTIIGGAERLRQRGEGLIAARERLAGPLVSCWTAGSLGAEGLRLLAEADQPYSTAPETCLRGIKALFDYRGRLADRQPLARPPELEAARAQVRTALLEHRAAGARVLGEREAAPLLAAYGLPMVPLRFAASADEATAAADELGYPAVAKADVPGLAHKSRLGGVRLGLADRAGVAAAFGELRRTLARTDPAAYFRGVLIQPEAPPALEAVLGIAHDPQFGPEVLLGLGGIYAETLSQVAVRLAPLRPADAEELIDETPLRATSGRAALADALIRLGWFAADQADLVAECDLNPIRIYAHRVLAVDALIILGAETFE
jgi:acetyltransferase